MASSGPPVQELEVWNGSSGTVVGQGGEGLCVAVVVHVWRLISYHGVIAKTRPCFGVFLGQAKKGQCKNRYGDLRGLIRGLKK